MITSSSFVTPGQGVGYHKSTSGAALSAGGVFARDAAVIMSHPEFCGSVQRAAVVFSGGVAAAGRTRGALLLRHGGICEDADLDRRDPLYGDYIA